MENLACLYIGSAILLYLFTVVSAMNCISLTVSQCHYSLFSLFSDVTTSCSLLHLVRCYLVLYIMMSIPPVPLGCYQFPLFASVLRSLTLVLSNMLMN